ncbi:MAG: hypothetical protein J6V36_02490 [Clostridia bacterium]|nr:hypothetical protein [Clostridia bacterium]
MAKIPTINSGRRICVICEGYEDYHYFKRLSELNVWNEKYDFCPINAKGASNIFARYQDIYSNDRYEMVLIFCDTDKAPYREYSQLKKKINNLHNGRVASEKIVIFANPCTMQIILLHFGEVTLKNQGKKTNEKVIFDLTGVEGYDAHEEQIKIICGKIFKRTYSLMKERVEKINFDDNVSCSTNFTNFISKFEDKDSKWIDSINKYLQKGV